MVLDNLNSPPPVLLTTAVEVVLDCNSSSCYEDIYCDVYGENAYGVGFVFSEDEEEEGWIH